MNIRTASVAELTALQSKGAEWFCVAAYAHKGLIQGDVISWHKTHDAAAKAAGSSQYRTVTELHYVLQDAQISESVL